MRKKECKAKTVEKLKVGDRCYLLTNRTMVDILVVTQLLESMRNDREVKIRFNGLLPECHSYKGVSVIPLGDERYIYLDKDCVLTELEYHKDRIEKQIQKLRG